MLCMISQIDRRLQDWATQILPGISVSLKCPEPAPSGKGIVLYLSDLLNDPPARGVKRPPLQLILRYLVTVWSDDVTEAHEWVFRLISAATDQAEFEIDRDPIPLALWQAFGISPRPAFLLRVPLRQERPER